MLGISSLAMLEYNPVYHQNWPIIFNLKDPIEVWLWNFLFECNNRISFHTEVNNDVQAKYPPNPDTVSSFQKTI